MLCEEGYDSLGLDLGAIDAKTRSKGMYYLLKSYEPGFAEVKAKVQEYFLSMPWFVSSRTMKQNQVVREDTNRVIQNLRKRKQ